MEEVNYQPIHIVMTPVRNEAWVLRAFLTATSLWADYIIVADQMSTDGSREIYADFLSKGERQKAKGEHFCELIVIDNNNPEFNEAERQAMLVAKAREVAAGRDTLLWGLDADEIIAANAFETEDWKRILSSDRGSVFQFRWANITADKKRYQTSQFFPWLFHDDGKEPHGNYVRKIHSMRIPYPIGEEKLIEVKDFFVLHLGFVPTKRVESKARFYTYVDWKVRNRSVVSLYRQMYSQPIARQNLRDIEAKMLYTKETNGFDLWDLVDVDSLKCWFDDYVYEHIQSEDRRVVMKLPIWDEAFRKLYQLEDPRTRSVKFLHWYFKKTKNIGKTFFVRAIDKVLKLFV